MSRFFRTVSCITLVALLYAPSALANTMAAGVEGIKNIQISKAGDLELDCHELSNEVSSMKNVIFETQEIQDTSELTSTGVGVAKALGSYLVGSLAGGIGIMAAGYIVGEVASDKAEDASKLQDAAMQRRSFMAGIYNAKGCLGPLEIALIEPAAGQEKPEGSTPLTKRRAPYDFND